MAWKIWSYVQESALLASRNVQFQAGKNVTKTQILRNQKTMMPWILRGKKGEKIFIVGRLLVLRPAKDAEIKNQRSRSSYYRSKVCLSSKWILINFGTYENVSIQLLIG